MKLMFLAVTILVGSLLNASAAIACSVLPLPPMTDEERQVYEKEQERKFLDFALNAKAIVEIKALSSSGRNTSSALIEIRKVHYGDAKIGKVLELRTVGASLCGAGGIRRGERGVTILEKGRIKTFHGLLREDGIESLREAGMIRD